MNDEYLWSKKGSDAEVESLEMILSKFRLEPGAAPIFASSPSQGQAGLFGSKLAWILRIAAPSFALALLMFWIFVGRTSTELQVRTLNSVDAASEDRKEVEATIPIKLSMAENKAKQRNSQPTARPTRVKTIHRTRRTKADRARSLTAMNLTREEQYAYDRLMLALSIAGTKLKVVQDTIDRTGEMEKRSFRNDK